MKDLVAFVSTVFDDGTLAPERTPEDLLLTLNKHELWLEEAHYFLVTMSDSLNELSPVETLAGKPLETRAVYAKRIESYETNGDEHPLALSYTGPGYTNGIHTSQQRILGLSLEERVVKVLHCAIAWGPPHDC
jgi:hypothetical protein